jgi:hypothetical protein
MNLFRNHSIHCCHRFYLANAVLGLTVFAISVFLTITGEYPNLAVRLHTEAVLNFFMIGGLLYAVTFWYVDRFTKPALFQGGGQA